MQQISSFSRDSHPQTKSTFKIMLPLEFISLATNEIGHDFEEKKDNFILLNIILRDGITCMLQSHERRAPQRAQHDIRLIRQEHKGTCRVTMGGDNWNRLISYFPSVSVVWVAERKNNVPLQLTPSPPHTHATPFIFVLR